MTLDKISGRLFDAKNIAIFTHINSDCDGFGSMFALYEGLKQIGKKCSMFVDGELNKFEGKIFDLTKLSCKELVPYKFDTFVAVDCPDQKRLGKYGEAFVEFPNSFRIDHHISKQVFAKNSYVEHDSASCCEIIYDLLNKLHVCIDKKIATYLYAGVATDTNSFVNTNTTARSYRIAEDLFKHGANTVLVNKQCFRTVSKESMALMKTYYEKIKFIGDDVAYVIINDKDFKRTKTSYLDTAIFSTLLGSIEGIKVGCSVTERNGAFYFSFRSVLGINVNELATMFGGGGHNQAAGATMSAKEKVVEKTLVENVKKFMRDK